MKARPIAFYNLPAIESLLKSSLVRAVWSEVVTKNEKFVDQAEKRCQLIENHKAICGNLPRPDISLGRAVANGMVEAKRVTEFYERLNDLLEMKDYQRLLLYLPFEYLPDKDKPFSDPELQRAAERFCCAFLAAWHNQLETYDVRANFVDGDVMEEEYRSGDHPRVVKAAHLVPQMVEHGLLSLQSVIDLMENCDDAILKDSLADTLPVLADLGYINEQKLMIMEKSPDQLVGNMARMIAAKLNSGAKEAEEPAISATFDSIRRQLAETLSLLDTKNFGPITDKRKKWLKQTMKQEIVSKLGARIAQSIVKNDFPPVEIDHFLQNTTDKTIQWVLAEGIKQGLENLAQTDAGDARKAYALHRKTLTSLWSIDNQEVREILLRTFRRLNWLGVVDSNELAALKIASPHLAGSFKANLELLADGIEEIENLIKSIEADPKLSSCIFPVVLAFGSRLKGYGEQTADIDVAVFVKPGTAPDDYAKIKKRLITVFSHELFHGEITIFWLESDKDSLVIRDFDNPDCFQGESGWVHILFGAAWIGDREAVIKIRKELLTPYLFDSGEKKSGRPKRSLYLEEMERDNLLYRLLHKGYERFYPPCGGIKTPQADQIDGHSLFYDSGYRRLATQLFLERVFLPEL